jgi:uncharacterized protein (DUF433 family)
MPRRHSTFRLDARTIEHLDRRAQETGESRAALAERYLEEGLRMAEHPQIVFRDGGLGRRPVLAGTRLDVWQVIDTVKHSGNSIEDAAEYLEISPAQVRACRRYYAEYQDEIDAWTGRAHEVAEREERAWRREQEVLA